MINRVLASRCLIPLVAAIREMLGIVGDAGNAHVFVHISVVTPCAVSEHP